MPDQEKVFCKKIAEKNEFTILGVGIDPARGLPTGELSESPPSTIDNQNNKFNALKNGKQKGNGDFWYVQ